MPSPLHGWCPLALAPVPSVASSVAQHQWLPVGPPPVAVCSLVRLCRRPVLLGLFPCSRGQPYSSLLVCLSAFPSPPGPPRPQGTPPSLCCWGGRQHVVMERSPFCTSPSSSCSFPVGTCPGAAEPRVVLTLHPLVPARFLHPGLLKASVSLNPKRGGFATNLDHSPLERLLLAAGVPPSLSCAWKEEILLLHLPMLPPQTVPPVSPSGRLPAVRPCPSDLRRFSLVCQISCRLGASGCWLFLNIYSEALTEC